MMNTYIRGGFAVFLLLILFASQGCGTTMNLLIGPPEEISSEEFTERNQSEAQFVAVRDKSIRDNTRMHDVQLADVIGCCSPMLYGGVLHDINWIYYYEDRLSIWAHVYMKFLALIDIPLSIAGDTITGPFILLFSERYIGL